MQEDYKKITKYYGIHEQIRHFNQECFELTEAMHHCLFKVNGELTHYEKLNITSEIADVMNFVNQFVLYFDLDLVDIEQEQIFKNKRTIMKIDDELKKQRQEKQV